MKRAEDGAGRRESHRLALLRGGHADDVVVGADYRGKPIRNKPPIYKQPVAYRWQTGRLP